MRHAIPAAFHALILLVGILLLVHSWSDTYPEFTRDENMLYPRFILTAWICCAAAALIKTVVRRAADAQPAVNRKAFCIAVVVSAAFLLLLVPLGFWIASTLFFIGYGLALGYSRRGILLVGGIGVTAFFWWLFEIFLNIPLPRGLLALAG